jgi:hypothetical protein
MVDSSDRRQGHWVGGWRRRQPRIGRCGGPALCTRGFAVAVTGRSPEALAIIADEISTAGGHAIAAVGEMQDEAEIIAILGRLSSGVALPKRSRIVEGRRISWNLALPREVMSDLGTTQLPATGPLAELRSFSSAAEPSTSWESTPCSTTLTTLSQACSASISTCTNWPPSGVAQLPASSAMT